MHVNDRIWSIYIVIAIICSALSLSGCGGGGGGSPVASTPALPDTPLISLKPADLATSGESIANPFNQGALGLSIPTVTKSERYAVLLANSGSASTIKVNGGGGTAIGSVRSSLTAAVPPSRPVCGTPALRESRKQLRASAIRANRVPTVRMATIGEKLNDVVSFSIYSGGVSGLYNATYTKRNGVLRRIGEHCKLFVDPESSPNGLSAVTGAYAITEAQLDTMVASFDQNIYPLMTQQYGPSYDMDHDGKVAVFLSPLVTQNGFAGFFDTEHFTTSVDSNQRDMFCMWTPSSTYQTGLWLAATCETIAHEFQHLINYSDRLVKNGYNTDTVVEEEVWLDEALSMGAEIRYRLVVGDPATEGRFINYMYELSTKSLTSFGNSLADYGRVGLFAHYLFERGTASRIKMLVTSGLRGKENINAAFADHVIPELRTFDGIFKNWTKAVFVEMNRENISDLSVIPQWQRFSEDFDLNRSQTTAITYGAGAQDYLPENTLTMFIFKPSTGYSADSFALYLQAVTGTEQQTSALIDCTVMRLNDAQ